MYELNQIKEILKKPKRAKQIQKARKAESVLRVFTEPKDKQESLSEDGYKEFLRFIDNNFKKERADKIKNYILFPLSSVDITDSILKDLYKVFEARNAFFDFEVDDKGANKSLSQLINKVDPVSWITEQGKKVLKNQPNLVVVIDKDKEGTPYLLPITPDRLIDCEINEDGSLSYVAFVHSIEKKGDEDQIKRISFYDDTAYNVLIEKDEDYILDEDHTNAHEAGVCPARMFMTDKLNSKDDLSRKIPFSSSLSKLMEWQYFDIYKFYVDHYASFPVIEKIEDECDIEGCESGYIRYEEKILIDGEYETKDTFKECPNCHNKDLIGPGLVVNIPAKQSKDDPDSSGVFKMISPETDSLKYLDEKLREIEAEIKLKTVGIDKILTKEAINEKQAQGSFESRQNVLLSIKDNLDKLYKWIITTMAKLEHGSDQEVYVNANFGTEFYLLTEEELQQKYESGKKSGLPAEELDLIYDQIINTKYKGNPSKLKRLEIINLLDPLPHDNLDVAFKKQEKNIINESELKLKGRLIGLINRFEIEQGPLTEFGVKKNLPERVNKIKEILNQYINEYESETKPTG